MDTLTGAATGWNPGCNSLVKALASDGTAIYAGGGFSQIDGAARRGVAAIDPATAQPLPWIDPDVDINESEVNAVAVLDGVVYLGGSFSSVQGQARSCLAALNARTGEVLPWNPGATNIVWSLAAGEGSAYAGGVFGAVGGEPHACLAGIAAASLAPEAVAGVSGHSEAVRLAVRIAPNPVRSSAEVRFTLPTAALV